MAILTVNGIQLSVDQNQKLLPFLRDTLHLTSVKNGCSEGACGTCMVLIDGKAVKACIQQTDKLAGKTIVISGVFEHHSRDEYKAMIERNGGKNSGSISKKTDFVFAGANMGPAKLEKARSLGIPIIGEDEFLKMIE